MRKIPIFTFINKMDRETRDPLELCEEVEKELGIDNLRRQLAHRLRQGV